jgi:carboxypeptidase Q
MRRVLSVVGVLLAFASTAPIAQAPQEKIDREVYFKIRSEAVERSQILHTLHMLTDVYGPRLTGSPNLKAASDWVVKRTTEWGLKNAHLEPWEFGKPGWANERTSAFLIAPTKDSLVVEALSWTPGTNGAVTGAAVQIDPPSRVTKEQLAQYFEKTRGTVKGRIVFAGAPAKVPVTILPSARRRDDAELRASFDPSNPTAGGPPGGPQAAATPTAGLLPAADVAEQFDQFLVSAGALARVNDAGRDHGQIRAFNNRTFDVSKAVPTLVMRNEDYGRISRLLADKMDVQLEINIVNRTYPEGATQHNVIAEIPGTDKAQEVVMLGGHLDSWHAATGATDNAAGCAIMMEAARILQAIGVKPRRTIRVALWGGEEQGLLGSEAYVEQHFGTAENPKPAWHKFNGYFNIDSGTGRVRIGTVFGPPEAAAVLTQIFKPFDDFGLFGAMATNSRRSGGTDSTSFNQAGLPGIGFTQDPIQYNSHTWHTNLDTYERIVEDDVKKSAAAVASAVYHLAMRDEMLPRFAKDKMPAPPAPAGGRGGAPVNQH